jgi:hypothetical protein
MIKVLTKGDGMSVNENSELIELAVHHMDYWTGTIWEKVLAADIERQDLESLAEHIRESAKAMYDKEYNPGEVYELDENDTY